jgi:hypothetical protein
MLKKPQDPLICRQDMTLKAVNCIRLSLKYQMIHHCPSKALSLKTILNEQGEFRYSDVIW